MSSTPRPAFDLQLQGRFSFLIPAFSPNPAQVLPQASLGRQGRTKKKRENEYLTNDVPGRTFAEELKGRRVYSAEKDLSLSRRPSIRRVLAGTSFLRRK